ncbi:MAG: hypothetical protein Q8909_06970 [Bacteroidota bacterium]|nr:hypothetical protein [Bacteroidota bacterium]
MKIKCILSFAILLLIYGCSNKKENKLFSAQSGALRCYYFQMNQQNHHKYQYKTCVNFFYSLSNTTTESTFTLFNNYREVSNIYATYIFSKSKEEPSFLFAPIGVGPLVYDTLVMINSFSNKEIKQYSIQSYKFKRFDRNIFYWEKDYGILLEQNGQSIYLFDNPGIKTNIKKKLIKAVVEDLFKTKKIELNGKENVPNKELFD